MVLSSLKIGYIEMFYFSSRQKIIRFLEISFEWLGVFARSTVWIERLLTVFEQLGARFEQSRTFFEQLDTTFERSSPDVFSEVESLTQKKHRA